MYINHPTLRCCASIALAALMVIGTASAQPGREAVPMASLEGSQRAEIEALLTEEMDMAVSRQKRLDGQGVNPRVRSVKLDVRNERIVIDLSPDYLPRGEDYIGPELEDAFKALTIIATELLVNVVQVKEIEYLFDGKDIFQYFPRERPREPRAGPPAVPKSNGTVVASAGHGVYYHYGFSDWRAQRDPSNGITEDFITPSYNSELIDLLIARSGSTVHHTRSSGTTLHPASGFEWWQMAARYYLEALLPGNPEIWNSLPTSGSNQRERLEDIRSRPLYANHLGADAVIHIHTNSNGATATGTRAYHYTGRTVDQQLSNSVLCYMRELITAQDGYENFSVSDQSLGDTMHGENRLAEMPSVIVEVAFHTNPSDAAALQDPVF